MHIMSVVQSDTHTHTNTHTDRQTDNLTDRKMFSRMGRVNNQSAQEIEKRKFEQNDRRRRPLVRCFFRSPAVCPASRGLSIGQADKS